MRCLLDVRWIALRVVLLGATACAAPSADSDDPGGGEEMEAQDAVAATADALRISQFRSCDARQQQILRRAADDAYQLAVNAYNDFGSDPFSERAQRWFGDVNEDNYNTILWIMWVAMKGLEGAAVFDCSPQSSCGYAQIQSTQTPIVYFWPLFFGGPSGRYTPAEVMYHEFTHLGGSSDQLDACSSYELAHDMAVNSPSNAAYCSFNFQYFAANAQVGPDAPGCL